MRFITQLIAGSLLLLCIGCSTPLPANEPLNKQELDKESQNLTDCESVAGVWIEARYGSGGDGYCVTPSDDAGRACRTSRECQSACVTQDSVKAGQAASGQCFAWSNLAGHCVNKLNDDGLADGTVCYD